MTDSVFSLTVNTGSIVIRGQPLDIQGKGLGRSGDEKLFISRQCDAKIFFSHSRDAKIFLPTFSVTEHIHGA